jgi:hypothetical protein
LRTTIGQVPIRREVISKAVVVEAAAEDRVEQPIDASVELVCCPLGFASLGGGVRVTDPLIEWLIDLGFYADHHVTDCRVTVGQQLVVRTPPSKRSKLI